MRSMIKDLPDAEYCIRQIFAGPQFSPTHMLH
jgi:hypothetical protein